MQVEERVDPRKMNCYEGIQHCDATALEMGELHHDRTGEANAAFEYCFDKANVLRLNPVESIHKHYSLFHPSAAQWSLHVPLV